MTNPQTQAQTQTTEAQPGVEGDFAPLHEDDYISEELSEEFNREIWIHKPTGRPYFPEEKRSHALAQLPVFDHDDPFLQFLRGEIEL